AAGNGRPEEGCSAHSSAPASEKRLRSPVASAHRLARAFVKRSFGAVLAAASASSASQSRLQPRLSAAVLTVTMFCADESVEYLVSNGCHPVRWRPPRWRGDHMWRSGVTLHSREALWATLCRSIAKAPLPYPMGGRGAVAQA